jgi:inosine-uridine nucleoside N-ribohydrolase
MALLFAFNSPEVIVEGLSTIFGNSGTKVTTENTLRLVELAGRAGVPVARGAEKPLLRPFIGEGWRVHGRNGLGDIDFPAPQGQPDPRRGALLIVDLIMANPGQMTLVALGPLTNVALAVALEPRLAEQADASGNASATAEANIRNDPEAAKIVFEAPWPVTMVGLDVTRKTIMTPEYIETLRAAGNPFTDFIGQIVPHYMDFYREYVAMSGFFVHDSSAIAYVVDPSLFETKAMHVDVETHSPINFGLTATDWRPRSDQQPNANVCVDVDSERFLNLYHQRLTETKT